MSTLFMWQNATGINAINYYSPTVRDLDNAGPQTEMLMCPVLRFSNHWASPVATRVCLRPASSESSRRSAL